MTSSTSTLAPPTVVPEPPVRSSHDTDGRVTTVLGTDKSITDVARGTGYHQSFMSRVFSGERRASGDLLLAIAGFLGMPVESVHASLTTARSLYLSSHPKRSQAAKGTGKARKRGAYGRAT